MRLPFVDDTEHFVLEGVSIYLVSHIRLRELLYGATECLSHSEHVKMSRLQFDSDREKYAFAHALLRFALAHALEPADRSTALAVHASRLDIRTDPLGKPFLANSEGRTPVFSLSRSSHAVAISIGWNTMLGIDVESVEQAEMMSPALVRYAFSAREQQYLAGSLQPKEEALKLWTRKEALAKAYGLGLRLPVSQIDTFPTSDWQVLTKQADSEVFSLALRR